MSEAGTQQTADGENPSAEARSFGQRFIGAFRLDGSVYEEVASDPAALAQAAGVAAIAGCANAVASIATATSGQAVVNALLTFAMWPTLSVLAWCAGKLVNVGGELGRILKVTGFAMAPMALVAVGVAPIPWLAVGVSLVAVALFFGAFVVGLRQALRIDSGQSAFISIIAVLGFAFLFMVAKYAVYQTGGVQ
jgi:hypothetical protein